jgi:hypothetical protein
VNGDTFFNDPTDSDSIGLAEQVVKGIGVFCGHYSAIDSSANMCCIGGDDEDESVSSLSTTSTSTVNVLKPYLHCLGTQKRIVSGPPYGIHVKLMHRKGLKDDTIESQEPVTYRSFFLQAMEMLKNCKKALSVVMAPDSLYKD